MAEGMYDLRWLTYRDGVPSELEVFPEAHRPELTVASVDVRPPLPRWSPDGGSVAWIEWTGPDEVVLRTVGWDDGPGTGRAADATFELDLPAGVQLHRWRDTDEDTTQLVASDGEREWTIRLQREADGGWALPSDPVQVR